jgi:Cohesin domain/PKD-like domain/Dockerin type I domain
MMKPDVSKPAFRRLCLILTLALSAFIHAFGQPTPAITGDTVVCQGDSRFYSTPYSPGNSYAWSVSPGGTILQNMGPYIEVKWNGQQNSTQSVSVTETAPGGASGTAQLTVLIKNNNLSCEDLIYVSLDQTGQAVITPGMLLEGNYNTYEGFVVVVSTPWGATFNDVVDCSLIGTTLTGTVTVDCTGNSCWGTIVVEDKKAPVFDCPADTANISCEVEIDSFPPPTVVDNCDDNVDLSLTGIQIDNDSLCNGVLITKHWAASDNYGNSSSCVQHLFMVPNGGIDFPEDQFWDCAQYNQYPNITGPTALTGDPATTGSGIPSGASGVYCQYTFVHQDEILGSCGNTFKIIRTWTVIDWCTGDIITKDINGDDNEQIIEIFDNTPPALSVPDITLNATNPGILSIFCTSTGLLPPPTSYGDECGDVTVRIFTPVGEAEYLNGTDGADGGFVPSPGLNIGTHVIIYKAIDGCGNVTELPVSATVGDYTPPTVVCDEITDVNLDITGYAEVFANTFDDGSHDNCCIDEMVVKRMGQSDSYFAPAVTFSCDDDTVMVVMRVYDCFGNHNECMVTALVSDKIAPTCIAPPNKVITCTDIPADIDQAWVDGFGQPSAYDNCGAAVIELPYDVFINACGEGTVIRYFVAVDSSANISGTCKQIIQVTPVSDWVIHFPPNYYGSCGDSIPAPSVQIENYGCDQFAVSIKDQYFNLTGDSACFQIVRTYKVRNWCYYDPYEPANIVNNNPDGEWIDETFYTYHGNFEYQQIIKINDDTPPVLSYPFSSEFCSYDTSCSEGHVFLPIQIDGECTDQFEIVYHLDLFKDLSFDLTGEGFYDGYLPLGEHRIHYIVSDACGNESDIGVDFSIVDCKKPVAVCSNGLIVEIMQTGMVEICASDLNDNSYDNCGGELTYSFSTDVGDSCHIFTCAQVFLEIPVEIWVTDDAGNQDYCATFIIVQDNLLHCDTGTPLSGYVLTPANDGVQDVNIQLNSTNNDNYGTMTGPDGTYEFTGLEAGQDYTVTPLKDVNPLNGVSTFDLVLMSRHILGIQPLDSPYKRIAADVNNSGSITTFDLVELRKMILFINLEFPNNTSWRFVDKNFVLPDPQNPWQTPFPEVINVNDLSAPVTDADFTAIKIGDVNGSAVPNDDFAGGNEDRSAVSLWFGAADEAFQAGETLTLTLTAKDFEAVSGFQFTLNFDLANLEFSSVVPTNVTTSENFGLALEAEGAITASWHQPQPLTLEDGEAVARLEFRATHAGTLHEMVHINSRFTSAEAYVGPGGTTPEVVNVGLNYSGDASLQLAVSEPELYQNIPNPFSNRTIVGFSLPEACRASITLYNTNGKVVRSIEDEYPAGYNEVVIQRRDLPANGVLFYRLQTPSFQATRKMTLVNQ